MTFEISKELRARQVFLPHSLNVIPGYKNVRDGNIPELLGAEEFIEYLWQIYAPYADSNFQSDAVIHFQERFWEMYLGARFLQRIDPIKKFGDEGPDFCLNTASARVLEGS